MTASSFYLFTHFFLYYIIKELEGEIMNKKTILAALKETIPVFMGYIVLGIAFGMLMAANHYSVIYTAIMSVFIFAGSMQFVAISLLTSQASFLDAAIMTLMINARHLFYGISMLRKFDIMGKLKPYMIFSLSDETYSLLVKQHELEGINEKYFLFFISLFDQCYWIIGSIIGTLLGSMIHINTTGLDFSMTALFIVIVVDQVKHSKHHEATYIGFLVSIIALLLFGSDNFIIPSMIGILLLLAFTQRRLKQHYE